MNAQKAIEAGNPLALLRVPFEPHHISKLPKPTKKQTDDVKADFKKGIRCQICGAWHHPDVVHLDYVGHAALTDRLLDTDPEWSWEPVGFTPEGLPKHDHNGGLWIKLTVCGVTRFGYGAADGKTGGDAVKEIIGDALRNAAMRFGAALDLWHKGDLHPEEEQANPTTGELPPVKRQPLEGPHTSRTALEKALKDFVHRLNGMGDFAEFVAWGKTIETQELLKQCKRDLPEWFYGGPSMPDEWVPLELQISRRKRELEEIDELVTASGANNINAG